MPEPIAIGGLYRNIFRGPVRRVRKLEYLDDCVIVVLDPLRIIDDELRIPHPLFVMYYRRVKQRGAKNHPAPKNQALP